MAPPSSSTRVSAQRIGSLLFCPACGTLLDLPEDNKDEIACHQCGRIEPASSYENLPTKTYSSENAFPSTLRSKRALVQNKVSEGEAAKGRDPVAQEKCQKCGHIGLSYKELQLRSADEGSTIFYKESEEAGHQKPPSPYRWPVFTEHQIWNFDVRQPDGTWKTVTGKKALKFIEEQERGYMQEKKYLVSRLERRTREEREEQERVYQRGEDDPPAVDDMPGLDERKEGRDDDLDKDRPMPKTAGRSKLGKLESTPIMARVVPRDPPPPWTGASSGPGENAGGIRNVRRERARGVTVRRKPSVEGDGEPGDM